WLALTLMAGRARAETADPAPAAQPAAAPADEPPERNALAEKIDQQQKVAGALIARVWALKKKASLSQTQATRLEAQINEWTNLLKSVGDRAAALASAKKKANADQQKSLKQDEEALSNEVSAAAKSLTAIQQELGDLEKATGWNLIGTLLTARCATAICFDNATTKNW